MRHDRRMMGLLPLLSFLLAIGHGFDVSPLSNIKHCKYVPPVNDTVCFSYWNLTSLNFDVNMQDHYKHLLHNPHSTVNDINRHQQIPNTTMTMERVDILVDARCFHQWPFRYVHGIADCLVNILPPLLDHLTSNFLVSVKAPPKITFLVDESTERLCSNMQTENFALPQTNENLTTYELSGLVHSQDVDFFSVFRDIIRTNASASCSKVSLFHWESECWYQAKTLPMGAKEYIFLEAQRDPNNFKDNWAVRRSSYYVQAVQKFRGIFLSRFSRYCSVSQSLIDRNIISYKSEQILVKNIIVADAVAEGKAAIIAEVRGSEVLKSALRLGNNGKKVAQRYHLINFTGDESMCDTIALFQSAKVIIGASSPSLVNTIFSASNALIIEVSGLLPHHGHHERREKDDLRSIMEAITRSLGFTMVHITVGSPAVEGDGHGNSDSEVYGGGGERGGEGGGGRGGGDEGPDLVPLDLAWQHELTSTVMDALAEIPIVTPDQASMPAASPTTRAPVPVSATRIAPVPVSATRIASVPVSATRIAPVPVSATRIAPVPVWETVSDTRIASKPVVPVAARKVTPTATPSRTPSLSRSPSRPPSPTTPRTIRHPLSRTASHTTSRALAAEGERFPAPAPSRAPTIHLPSPTSRKALPNLSSLPKLRKGPISMDEDRDGGRRRERQTGTGTTALDVEEHPPQYLLLVDSKAA